VSATTEKPPAIHEAPGGSVFDRPLRFGVLVGLVAWFFAFALFTPFGPQWVLPAFGLSIVYAGFVGVAGWALAVGRRGGGRRVEVVAVAAILALPVISAAWFLSPSAKGIIDLVVEDTFVSTPPLTGIGLTIVGALAAAGMAQRFRGVRGDAVYWPWWLVGLLAAVAALYLMHDWTPEGADPGYMGLLAGHVVAVAIGGSAIAWGIRRGIGWLIAIGWIAVTVLPVLTAVYFYTGLGVQLFGWATEPLVYYLILGYLLVATLVLALAVAHLTARQGQRPRWLQATVWGLLAALPVLFVGWADATTVDSWAPLFPNVAAGYLIEMAAGVTALFGMVFTRHREAGVGRPHQPKSPSPEVGPPAPGRRRRRLLLSLGAVVVGLVGIFYLGGGWYFSGEIDRRALDASERLEALMTPHDDYVVVDLSEDTITLHGAEEDLENLTRPGVWGVDWGIGYGLAGEILEELSDVVTRTFELIAGEPPFVGDPVEFEALAMPDDPSTVLDPPPVPVRYLGPQGDYPAWWFPGESSTWVVMTHGNGLQIADHAKLVPALHEAGYPVLTIAYRNAPDAPLDPTGKLQYGVSEWEDLEAAVDYATEQGAERVILIGPSMGGAVITRFLYDSPFAESVVAAVLEAPILDFGRTVDLNAARETLPLIGLPVPQSLTSVAKWMASLRFGVDWEAMDLLARAEELRHPVLIFHGLDDTDVPIATSREFAALRPDLVTLVEVDEASHMGAWNVDPAAFESRMLAFLAERDGVEPSPDSSTGSLPIDEDWTMIQVDWGVTPSGGDMPALGPVSPQLPSTDDIPTGDGLEGLEDGFYDVTVSRPADPPGVLLMKIRPWVSCADTPGRCIADAPDDGIVPDPEGEIERVVFMDDQLTVLIRPLGDPEVSGNPPMAITGTGTALYVLLSGWCDGFLEHPLTRNCGADHAFTDWMWEPFRAGSSLEEIETQIRIHTADAGFPLRTLVHEPGLPDCPTDQDCLIAYRGPRGSNLILGKWLAEADEWPGYELYRWWTSLEIRDGRPIIYIDTAQIAG
jgi:uncharacterized protein